MSNVASYGWMGKILRVDLATREIREESTLEYVDRFIGGRGIDVKILYDEVPPEVDAFDPENRILFGAGPLTGTPVPGGGRLDVVSRSPLTGILGRSSMGGHCGAELKFCGYDHLIVQGKSDSPVYLYVNDDGVQIKDGQELWGRDTYETQELLRERHSQKVKVLCIGPAGENMVRFASVLSGLGSAAGRTGLGAVMGSKNLKAIALSGSKGVKVARPEDLLELTYQMQRVLLDLSSFQREGKIPITDLNGDRFEERGMLVAGNFESSIGPTVKIKNLLQKKGRPYGCTGCIMPCKQVFELPGVGLVSGTCAYQGLASSFWTEDPKSWGEVVILTQKLGIDQVTLMFLIAFIMEMYGKGIMNREDTDGIAMDRGNMGGVISMVHKIATREGCGNVFAEGTLKAARMLGRGMERYVMHNKGLELLPVALRNKKATSLAAAVSNRGDFQTEVWPLGDFMGITEEGKKWVRDFAVKQNLKKEHIDSFINPMSYDHAGDIVKHFQPLTVIVDLIGWCKWMSLHSGKPVYPEDQAKIVSAVTNMDIDGSGLIEAAERVYNLERAYNVRVGITRENDSLPERFFAEPAKARVGDGEMLDHGKFEKMKDEYYELRGWDVKTGIPTSKTLKGLGLKDVAKDLKKRE